LPTNARELFSIVSTFDCVPKTGNFLRNAGVEMRQLARVGAGLLLLSGFFGEASAADLPANASTAPPAPPIVAYNWTGCHVGGHVGGVLSDDRSGPGLLGNTISFSSVGFVGGGQIGCDYQFAPGWLRVSKVGRAGAA
jgi:outer membrane immunogenic protein